MEVRRFQMAIFFSVLRFTFWIGFGSLLHVEGQALAIAIDADRVLLPHPDGPKHIREDFSFITENSHCRDQGKANLDCYFESWSHCNLDRELQRERLSLQQIREYSKRSKDRIMRITQHGMQLPQDYVPAVFHGAVECSPIRHGLQVDIRQFEFFPRHNCFLWSCGLMSVFDYGSV